MKLTLILLATVFSAAPQDAPPKRQAPAVVADQAADAKVDDAAIIAAQLPAYPLATCPVSGEKLGGMGDVIDVVVEGRLVRLCCKGCVKKVTEDPRAYITKVDDAVKAAQGATYPLTTCPISGEELGSMGEPIDVVVGTKLVRVCCKGCVKGVQKKADEVMAKVDAGWIAAQRDSYPLTKCLISGEAFSADSKPVELLYGVRLVKFCCNDCARAFSKEPAKYLATLDAASADRAPAKEASAPVRKSDGDGK